MKTTPLIALIKTSKKPVFSFNDLIKITNQKRTYLKLHLFRLKKRGLIHEVERGKYILPQHPYLTASALVFPAYISFLSAYSYYQITTQIPRTIFVVSLRSKKSLELDNYQVDFIKFPSVKLFGYKKEIFEDKYIFIAEKEKALIDSLFLPQYCPLSETHLALEEGFDTEKLCQYALKMDSIVLLKRLGYLLERQGKDVYPLLKNKLNKRYDLLNPQRKKTNKKDKKWRLIINEVF
ncbi:hypothetical protein HZC30_03195 [Candidatus Woesearchaeota archaeon]|nr:hypothetical protein [Candidatus Woesearchaeota archaeon]